MPARKILTGYLIITVGLAFYFGLLILLGGRPAFLAVQSEGRGSISVGFNFVVFWVSWLLLGGILSLGLFPRFVKRHAAFLVVFFLIAFSYLNSVREPHRLVLGDFWAYFQAADCVHRGVSIDQEPDRLYLYPPLFAVALSPFTRFGVERLLHAFHLANYAAALVLAVLLYRTLQRFRFSRTLAALSTLALFAANVPMMRTLIYHQVNIHVANLVLLSFLLWPRRPIWSALFLCLAIHLKVYPVVLVVPFLVERQWRWCIGFVLANAAVVLGTIALSAPSYYQQFFAQAGSISETAYRATSIDSFLYNTLRLLHVDAGGYERVVALSLRLVLAAAFFAGYWRLRHRETFVDGNGPLLGIANGFVVLPLLMLAVSPSVWSHHFVLLMMPMIVLATGIRAAIEAWLWGLSYVFIFLVPIFDIYPVSYERLVAILLLLALVRRIAARESDGLPTWLTSMNARADALAG